MPLYAYDCPNGHEVNRFVVGNPFRRGFKTPKRIPCDFCAKVAIRKEVNRVSMQVDHEYISENIHPEGKPVLIKNRRHKKELMRKYGLREKANPFG